MPQQWLETLSPPIRIAIYSGQSEDGGGSADPSYIPAAAGLPQQQSVGRFTIGEVNLPIEKPKRR